MTTKTQSKRKVPFDALPMHECEILIEAVRRTYGQDFHGLAYAYLRHLTDDELRAMLCGFDMIKAATQD